MENKGYYSEVLDDIFSEAKGALPAPLPIYYQSDRYSSGGEIRTGTDLTLSGKTPEFIEDMLPFEPVALKKDSILEECQAREVERIGHPELLLNRIVYDSMDPSPIPTEPSSPGELPPFYVPTSEEDTTLTFESRFESGNLRRAVQVYEYEYDLILKPDYNTKGNTQWYYFRVGNTRAGRPYRFNFINMMKPDSLYNYGMRPIMYSVTDATRYRRGWVRCGYDVCYYQNTMRRKQPNGFYYTLSVTVEFIYDYDVVYFAHCYPYTLTDLQKYLDKITSDPRKRNRCRRRVLCQTIAGNDCEMLTITSFTTDPEAMRSRKGVIVMSRVHPGETNASWMLKGAIDYLVGPTLDAKILRDHFVFKIIPMLNPDGVVNGSYRCGLAGVDLNRTWSDPSKKLHPTIHNAKNTIRQFCEEREVVLCVDFHGHSRKKNMFMYGCAGHPKHKERVFPKLLERRSEIFSYNDCMFGIQKSKESTARIVLYKDMNILNSFTLESSFCGADFGKHEDFHFNVEHLQEIGHNFCDAILDLCDPDQTKVQAMLEEIELAFFKDPEIDEADDDAVDSDYSGDEMRKNNKIRKKSPLKKKPPLPEKKKK